MELREQILRMFSGRLRRVMEKVDISCENLQEIRLRVGQKMLLRYENREFFVTADAVLTDRREQGLAISGTELRETLEAVTRYSAYAFEEEIRRGYLSVPGGHRIGLAGKAVVDQGRVRTLKYVTAMNIRISHEITGCADRWSSYFYEKLRPCHMLIVSPPGCGKTTLLRDMIRYLSEGDQRHAGVTVGVVDERSEIGGTYLGVPTHDLGMRTDLLDGCPKEEGMSMLLRSMTPRVLAVDEIGGSGDVAAIGEAIRSGCCILATLHGDSMREIREKPQLAGLLEARVFERYFFLEAGQTPGVMRQIYDGQERMLWEKKTCT